MNGYKIKRFNSRIIIDWLQEKMLLWYRCDFFIITVMYYQDGTYIIDSLGNNALSFQERKKQWSDTSLYVPELIRWHLEDVRLSHTTTAYEYVDEDGVLHSSYGLESLVNIDGYGKDLYVIDNHNHAFAMWWRSYLSWSVQRGSHLIHIDQHSDYAEPEYYLESIFSEYKNLSRVPQENIDTYTNEVLTIGSFIKPALQWGLLASHEMVLTEYSLLQLSILNSLRSIILDIDLDFRAPEMSIQEYEKTITQVRKLIFSPQVHCITIATSPTYINQLRALEVMNDLIW